MIERLNFEGVLKSTLSGSEFHTLTTRSLKKAALTSDTLRFLYSLYCCPLEGHILNSKNLSDCTSTIPNSILSSDVKTSFDTVVFATGMASDLLKSWVLACWWWRFDWSFARLIAAVVTTTSIILSSNKIQNGNILILTYPGCSEKWLLKWVSSSLCCSMQSCSRHLRTGTDQSPNLLTCFFSCIVHPLATSVTRSRSCTARLITVWHYISAEFCAACD